MTMQKTKMAIANWLLFFITNVLLVNCEIELENKTNFNELYKNDIQAVLNYLNSSSIKLYNYKSGNLLTAQTKADITELTLDVSVDCINNYPQVPCTESTLTCNAFVQENTEEGSKVLGEVKCKPKVEIVVDYVDTREIQYLTTESPQEVHESVALSHEAVSSASGEQFVAIRKDTAPCPGCPFDLNPQIDGVNELVELGLDHVESERSNKHVAVKVLRVQQQIVAGVKYILLLEIAQTICPKDTNLNLELCPINSTIATQICRIAYLQQPWISKLKQIISNNCTTSQEFNYEKLRNDMDNEIDVNDNGKIKQISNNNNPNFDDIASSGIINDDDVITSERLSDLESQIVIDFAPPIRTITRQPIIQQENQETKRVVEEVATAVKVDRKIVELNQQPQPQVSEEFVTEINQQEFDNENKTLVEEEQSQELVTNCSSNSSSEESKENVTQIQSVDDNNSSNSNSSEETSKTEQLSKLLNNDNNSNDSSSSSSSSSSSEEKQKINERQKRSIGQLEKITPEEKQLVKDLADFAAQNLDKIDDDNYKRIVLQILGAKKLISDGIYYHLILRLGISQCLEDVQQILLNDNNNNCREKLLENFTKICKVQVHVTSDYTNPKIIKSQCQNIKHDQNDNNNHSNYSRYKRQVLLGGQKEIAINDPKISKFVTQSLNHLDSVNIENDKKLKLIQIHSATSQVVAGIKYRIKIELALTDCNKNDITTTTSEEENCNNQLEGSRKMCDVTVWDRPWLPKSEFNIKCNDDEKVHQFTSTERIKRGLLGGQIKQDPNTIDVQSYVIKSLNHLDSESEFPNKYKIHEIISATKQIVSGTLWRITAKIVLSDCNKNSNVDLIRCNQLEGSEPKLCHFKIWDQPWLEHGRQTNITCEDETEKLYSYRSKRDLTTSKHDYIKLHVNSKQNDYNLHFKLFKEFINNYNKTYLTKLEYKYRFKVFIKNLKYIQLLNKYEQGTAKYGITKFSDLTRKEFSITRGLRTDLFNENNISFNLANIPNIDLPKNFDWRTKNVVTKIKDQGQCGSCWAFSVTGNVEGQYAIKYKKLLEFSEQELVDCDKVDEGCNGGLMDNAYRVIEELGGLETESDYPYDAKDEKCHFNKPLVRVQVKGALNISQNEDDMAKWLVQNGPISIAINANAMQFYMGGVSHPLKFLCSPENLDHGVLVVGYGVHYYPLFNKTLPYWIVKNSWGRSWGEQGYYRVYKGDGTCGLNKTPSSSIIV